MEIDENICWCPKCKVEYHAWAKTCSDCLVALVSELPEEDISPRDEFDPLKLLVSVTDESAAEAIASLLAISNIQVIREQNEDNDATFAIDLYVLESLVGKALTILHHQDDSEYESFSGDSAEDEAISEIEIAQGEHDGYTALQLFKKGFADEEDRIVITVAPGRNFLKITGVIYIIFSGLSIIGALMSPELSLPFILTLLLVGYRLLMGIMGNKYCNSISKANLLCIFVIADLLIRLFFLIRYVVLVVLVVQMQLTTLIFVFVIYIFDFVLPSLYLVGAYKNRSARYKDN